MANAMQQQGQRIQRGVDVPLTKTDPTVFRTDGLLLGSGELHPALERISDEIIVSRFPILDERLVGLFQLGFLGSHEW